MGILPQTDALPSPEWSGYLAWLGTTKRGDKLCCPLTVLWNNYQAHCQWWGFPSASAADFTAFLTDSTEGVTVREGGKGRLRRVAMGLAVDHDQTMR
jgi:hypothetical protein